jgi:hypothetical protein
MKWLGITVVLLGVFVFLALTAFETTLPLVQFVDKDNVVTTPARMILPKGTQFIKGTGRNGAKFVDIHSEAAQYINFPRYLGLAKLGSLVLCALGGVGFAFERWREKMKLIYQGPKP